MRNASAVPSPVIVSVGRTVRTKLLLTAPAKKSLALAFNVMVVVPVWPGIVVIWRAVFAAFSVTPLLATSDVFEDVIDAAVQKEPSIPRVIGTLTVPPGEVPADA